MQIKARDRFKFKREQGRVREKFCNFFEEHAINKC